MEEKREPYWDYMRRKVDEGRTLTREDMWKKEVADMQKQVHALQIRVKELNETVYSLSYKVSILGGNPNQLELEL